MTVVLDETLIAKGISTLLKKGKYVRIEDGRINGVDVFLGALVTRYGETFPDIALCGDGEGILGQVIGINTSKHLVHEDGPWYNDFDNPYANDTWVRIGIFESQGIYLVLSETNITVAVNDKLKVVTGVLAIATTIATTPTVPEHYQFLANEPKAAAADTRKYLYVTFVGQ